jgi:transcriptional regulator with GAF, ATPase, and Fis domain
MRYLPLPSLREKLAIHASRGAAGEVLQRARAAPGDPAETLDFLHVPSGLANPDEQVNHLTESAARLLGADQCTIMLLEGSDRDRLQLRKYSSSCRSQGNSRQECAQKEEAAAREAIAAGKSIVVDTSIVHSSPGLATQAPASLRSIIATPVRMDSNIVGAINVIGRHAARQPCSKNVAAVEIVGWLVGQALQATRLRNLLTSQFAQLAVAQETGGALDHALALSGERPGELVRILAKSFYREMTKLGFDSGHIIGAASEIISELSSSLKKHKARLRHAGANRQHLAGADAP